MQPLQASQTLYNALLTVKQKNLEGWIISRIMLEPAHASLSTKEIRKLAGQRLASLLKEMVTVRESFAKVKEHIRPLGCITKPFLYLIFVLEEKINLLLLNYPEDKEEIEAKWHEFRSHMAALRYEEGSELSQEMLATLHYVIQKLEALDPLQAEELKQILKIFDRFLSNPNLFDIEFGNIYDSKQNFNPGISYKLEVSVKHLEEIYEKLVFQIQKDADWVIDTAIDKLGSISLPWLRGIYINESRTTIEALVNFKREFLPQLQFVLLKDITDISKVMPLLIKLKRTLKHFTKSEARFGGLVPYQNIKEVENLYYFMREELVAERITQVTDLDSLTLKKYIKDSLIDPNLKFNFGDVLSTYSYFRAHNEAHMLFDTFLDSTFNTLYGVARALHTWYEFKSKKKEFREEILPGLYQTGNAQAEKQKQAEVKEDLDALWAYIEGSKSTKAKGKNKPQPSKRTEKKPASSPQKAKPPQPISKQTTGSLSSVKRGPKTNQASQTSLVSPPLFAEEMKFSQLLGQLVVSLKQPNKHFVRIAARQAKMHLDDLLVILRDHPHVDKPALALMQLKAGYYAIEQGLRTQRLLHHEDQNEACSLHDLKVLTEGIDIACTEESTFILKRLHLGNNWIYSTHDQLNSWQRYSKNSQFIPPLLLELRDLFDPSKTVQVLPSIKHYSDTVLKVVRGLPLPELEIKEYVGNLRIPSKNQEISLQIKSKMSLKTLRTLNNKLDCFLENLHLPPSHPVSSMINQAKQDIEVLTCVFEILNRPLPLNALSFYMREACFWQNALMERVMHAIYTLQRGIETSSHQLDTLYEAIQWSVPYTEKEKLLFTSLFRFAHNFSRYPFEKPSVSPLHDMILKAELLRELPNLLDMKEGFSISSKDNKLLQTDLNFTQVSIEGMDPEQMLAQLSNTWNQVATVLEKRLIPELERFISH